MVCSWPLSWTIALYPPLLPDFDEIATRSNGVAMSLDLPPENGTPTTEQQITATGDALLHLLLASRQQPPVPQQSSMMVPAPSKPGPIPQACFCCRKMSTSKSPHRSQLTRTCEPCYADWKGLCGEEASTRWDESRVEIVDAEAYHRFWLNIEARTMTISKTR